MRRLCGLSIAGVLAAVLVVAGVAAAADVQIALTIENNQFQPAEVKVKANTPFTLVVTNKNPKAAEFESKDLRVEKVVPAGKTVNVRIRALKPGTYAFFDDFNQATTGRIVAE
jgi:plastocyanin